MPARHWAIIMQKVISAISFRKFPQFYERKGDLSRCEILFL